MSDPVNLLSLTPEQKATAKEQIEQLEKIVRNEAALLDSGVLTKDQINQAKQVLELAKKSAEVFGA